MKTTIKNLILSAVLVVGGASCVDLDTAPYDRETDLTYWEEDPEAAVKALILAIPIWEIWTNSFIVKQ